jgi:hypothetical protein
LRLPPMTTRRWMIAVAVVGLLLAGCIGGYRLKRLHDHFLQRAQDHAMMEIANRKSERAHRELFEMRGGFGPGSETLRAKSLRDIVFFSRTASYHAAMAQKYEYAARHPWLPVAPDPPEPPLPPKR